VVVLMGVANRARIVERLLASGWSADTPAALLLGASTERSETWTGRLAELAAAPIPTHAADLPGTLVIGQAVSLRATLAPELPIQSSAQRMR
jgi:siroheme synthase